MILVLYKPDSRNEMIHLHHTDNEGPNRPSLQDLLNWGWEVVGVF